ncbi:LysM peptidoglycan-binding domain-containing protein [Kribbella swartbergensis]
MNATIRGLKGTLALVALAGLGLGLRWMTAGTFGAANRRDLDSMAVLAVGTVAWMAYGWLALAVMATVLEQIPGVIGAAASAVAGRITSQTSRTLLRSALGLAAVTPLTVGVAHASPGDGSTLRPWTQVEPRSTVQPGDAPWRTTEPPSSVLTGATAETRVDRPQDARPQDVRRDARPQDVVPGPRTTSPRVRVGVPDRPTSGAATRYTDVRSGQPVRVPARVVVKPGDTLWSIAAAELGPNATAEDIAVRWPAWYAANRQSIGPDPDLILPGQVLRTPAAATGNTVPPTHQEK